MAGPSTRTNEHDEIRPQPDGGAPHTLRHRVAGRCVLQVAARLPQWLHANPPGDGQQPARDHPPVVSVLGAARHAHRPAPSGRDRDHGNRARRRAHRRYRAPSRVRRRGDVRALCLGGGRRLRRTVRSRKLDRRGRGLDLCLRVRVPLHSRPASEVRTLSLQRITVPAQSENMDVRLAQAARQETAAIEALRRQASSKAAQRRG